MKFPVGFAAAVLGLSMLAGCAAKKEEVPVSVTLEKSEFGFVNGKPAQLYVLRNASGMEIAVTDYGAHLTRVKTPDAKGTVADVVLGFDTLDGYLASTPIWAPPWAAMPTALRRDGLP